METATIGVIFQSLQYIDSTEKFIAFILILIIGIVFIYFKCENKKLIEENKKAIQTQHDIDVEFDKRLLKIEYEIKLLENEKK